MIAKAVLETAELVGFEIAGELGVEAAKATALEVGKKAGAACAASLGATIGSEVGRIAGFQGASVAAAEELAKMNMNEITEEKAAELKGQFVDLGKSVGAATGAKAAAEAAKDIDIAAVLREAKAVAKEAAEEGALLAKLLTNAANDEARQIGKIALYIHNLTLVKFRYSEKATKLLKKTSYFVTVSNLKTWKFLAFSQYLNFEFLSFLHSAKKARAI